MIMKNLFTNLSNYEVVAAFKYILKAKTETATEPRSVMGIETPLDTMSIILQDRREKNQKSSSKQEANVTPPLVKGKKLQV